MAICISPVFNKKTSLHFPCGKCFACRRRRSEQWAFRLDKEAEISQSSFFVTLTYDDRNLHYTPNGLDTLEKKDLQNYFKRLRKLNELIAPYCNIKTKKLHGRRYTLHPIKYYAVGEYGGKFKRPHYHIILFNSNIEHIEQAWQLKNKMIGQIYIGSVQMASVQYILKYLNKYSDVTTAIEDDRTPEFSLMSKSMGNSYITQAVINWHRADLLNRHYVPEKDGAKISLPRYYKKHFYTQEERESIAQHLIKESDKKYLQMSTQEIENEHLILLAKVDKFHRKPLNQ